MRGGAADAAAATTGAAAAAAAAQSAAAAAVGTLGLQAAGSANAQATAAALAAGSANTNTSSLPAMISSGAFTTAALIHAPSGSGLTAQQTRDAMTIAPTGGTASIDAHLAAIEGTGTTTLAAVNALATIGGTGAFAMVVPFIGLLQDASTIVLEGVKSTATKNGIPTIAAPSNALGLTTLGLDAGTYRLTPFLQGYTSPSPLPTFAVSSDSTLTPIVLTQVTVTIPVPAGSTAAIIVCDEGTVGIAHTFRITAPPTGETGITYDYTPHTVLSDGSGVVQYACPYGCAMVYQRGKGREVPFTVPTSGTSFNPPDTIG